MGVLRLPGTTLHLPRLRSPRFQIGPLEGACWCLCLPGAMFEISGSQPCFSDKIIWVHLGAARLPPFPENVHSHRNGSMCLRCPWMWSPGLCGKQICMSYLLFVSVSFWWTDGSGREHQSKGSERRVCGLFIHRELGHTHHHPGPWPRAQQSFSIELGVLLLPLFPISTPTSVGVSASLLLSCFPRSVCPSSPSSSKKPS